MRGIRGCRLLGIVLLSLLAGREARAGFAGFAPIAPPSGAPAARAGAPPSIDAVALHGESIHVDGHLDEPVWQRAPAGDAFRVWEPDRGTTPTEQSVFKVAYDDDAIYFAVACLERDPSRVTAHLSRRDRFSDSDLVSIYIDPYDDNTTGYNFRVNPLGVLADAYIYNDGDRDDDWDAVWQGEAFHDPEGWYAELRIPFSSIRYRAGHEMTWGLQVYRYMHGRGEDTAWVTWDRDMTGFVSRWGELKGLKDVPAPRQLELVPYVLHRSADPAAKGHESLDHDENVGLDVKYGVTSDLTLNATLNPDFGQVEADPATLNLSPFETFFEEKRPFFIEGSRFFEMPAFNLYYSRRIGTGEDNSRIRAAGKLAGKIGGNTTLALLGATTDVAGEGQMHNLLKSGSEGAQFFAGRVGQSWAGGRFHANLMQTAVTRSAERDAYSTGADFLAYFKNRAYQVEGAVVGTIVDPAGSGADRKYGTGGSLRFQGKKNDFSFSGNARWEGDKLDPNDMGYLQAPDEISSSVWAQYRYNPDGKSSRFNQVNVNVNAYTSWLYASRTGYDTRTGAEAWHYGRGHHQDSNCNVNSWAQLRGQQTGWIGVGFNPTGTRRYETRGGPLIGEPLTYGGWVGCESDGRRTFVASVEMNHWRDTVPNVSDDVNVSLRWNQSSALTHEINASYGYRADDTQYLEQVDYAECEGDCVETPGIGGVSYRFGNIVQETVSLTLRSSVLFDRNKSLELYLEPFQTTGEYSVVKELKRADSYEFTNLPAVDPHQFDFSYAALNVNMVYRWEYRPGSTFYLVWTQSRSQYGERSFGPGYRGGLRASEPYRSEPENVILAKVSYWLPV